MAIPLVLRSMSDSDAEKDVPTLWPPMQAWVVVGAGSVHWLAGEPGSAWSSARSTRSTPQGGSSPTLSCWQRCSAAHVNGEPRIAFYR